MQEASPAFKHTLNTGNNRSQQKHWSWQLEQHSIVKTFINGKEPHNNVFCCTFHGRVMLLAKLIVLQGIFPRIMVPLQSAFGMSPRNRISLAKNTQIYVFVCCGWYCGGISGWGGCLCGWFCFYGCCVLEVVVLWLFSWSFLDASTHLYKRLCPSVGWSICPSVRHHFF